MASVEAKQVQSGLLSLSAPWALQMSLLSVQWAYLNQNYQSYNRIKAKVLNYKSLISETNSEPVN